MEERVSEVVLTLRSRRAQGTSHVAGVEEKNGRGDSIALGGWNSCDA